MDIKRNERERYHEIHSLMSEAMVRNNAIVHRYLSHYVNGDFKTLKECHEAVITHLMKHQEVMFQQLVDCSARLPAGTLLPGRDYPEMP